MLYLHVCTEVDNTPQPVQRSESLREPPKSPERKHVIFFLLILASSYSVNQLKKIRFLYQFLNIL